ncbi:MAG: outer membrane protein assembly factor BamB family protein [Planctomycetota bacterium]
MKTRRMIICLFVLSFLINGISGAADWPNWRGKDYNGISSEKEWDPLKVKSGVQPLWKASVGIGFSTFSVSDGRVYTMGNTKGEDLDVVYCFDAATGKEIWTHTYPQRLDPKYYEGGTLASPAVSGGKVYTISKDGKAFCLDAKTGQQVWSKNLLEELGIERPTWGQSGSPLIIDDMVIYNVGEKGVALNKEDGSVIWENGKTPSGYSTAVPCMFNGKQCIILCGSSEILGLVAATGEELWRFPWKTEHDVNAADAIIDGDLVFISSGYGHGCVLLKLEGNNVTEVWQNKNMRNKMNGSVLFNGNLYGVDEEGELRCLDFKTGDLIWSQKGFGQGSLMLADGKLIIMSENGNLVIAEASWSVPVLANGRIYVRNSDGDVVCLDVSANAAVSSSSSSDWPQWRGPNRDAKSTQTGLLKKWPEEGPELLWSTEGLGTGFSTVSISDGMIYTTGMVDKEGILFAYDIDGNLSWKKVYGPEWVTETPGVRCTPTVNEGNVYVTSGMGTTSCFDAKTGDEKWKVDVFSQFGDEYPVWGIADSPLIIDNKIICTPGGSKATVVALDKKTGELVWASKSVDENSAFCSPIHVKRGGKDIIVTMLAESLIGINAANGDVLWSDKCGEGDINPPSPLYYDGCIYYTSGYDDESVMYELSEDGTQIKRKWVNEVLDNHHGGVVLVDGYIYGSNWKGNPRGNWVCLEWETGKVMYETTWIGKGSIIFADDMLYCYEERKGTVALVEPTPEGFNIVSSFQITLGDEEHWGHPVICGGRLYIRHGDVLMAYNIKADS